MKGRLFWRIGGVGDLESVSGGVKDLDAFCEGGKWASIMGGGVGGGVGGHGGDHYNEKPDPFHFKYGVHDDKYYTDFGEERSGDEAGNIKGEYYVHLPDGRVQHVIYHADGNYGGTIMEVKYDGEAHHPDVVHHGGHGHHGHGGLGGGHGIVG